MRIPALFLVLFLMLPAPAGADGFFTSVKDLPLMAGLHEVPGTALLYDKPEGRLVELVARGPVSKKAAQDFFARTLPQLGWQPRAGSWHRDGEILRLGYSRENDELVVYLSINPQ
jgi:hypothetical protein